MLRADFFDVDQKFRVEIEPRDSKTETAPPLLPRPFLRWAGGKTRLLSKILPHVPTQFRGYHEPFLGAGAVFFAVAHRARAGCQVADLNEELINVWTAVRDRPAAFLRALKRYEGKDSERDYYQVRSAKPKGAVARAARFFYLNQTSWNSLWRVNRWGVFNVPWGARRFRGIAPEELRQMTRIIQNIEINHRDFRDSLSLPRKGDFVYLDPPYLPVSDTSKFSGYTEKRFRIGDLGELADLCRKLSERQVHWVLSNRDTPRVRELFSFAKIERLTARRSVSAQNRRDIEPVDSPEVIIVGRPSR
jgi:DNA adenine methylase